MYALLKSRFEKKYLSKMFRKLSTYARVKALTIIIRNYKLYCPQILFGFVKISYLNWEKIEFSLSKCLQQITVNNCNLDHAVPFKPNIHIRDDTTLNAKIENGVLVGR